MALKNFSFRKNWVGSEVAGMKITFFAIFDPTWAHILAPKSSDVNIHADLVGKFLALKNRRGER